jgi:hypothetical protein
VYAAALWCHGEDVIVIYTAVVAIVCIVCWCFLTFMPSAAAAAC